FGPVGLTLAAYLATACRARLVLVSRRGGAGHADAIARLEALGAEVLALAADVADAAAMRAVLDHVHGRVGALHGRIQAGGVAESLPLAQLTPEAIARQFRPKADGLFVLAEILADERALEFCVVCSSLSAVLGGLGFGAYAAANRFMDGFVRRHNAKTSG